MQETQELLRAEDKPTRGLLGIEWPHFASWQWQVLILLTLLNMLNYFDRQIILPMFPLLKEEFDVSDFRLGLLSSVFILVHSLSVLPFGYWSDRGPRQKIMAGGIFFWSAATLLTGLASSFSGLLSARALLGVGEGAYAPGGTAMISDSFPRIFRARVQSVFNFGMLLGGVIGLAVGGILAEKVGWRIAFFLVAVPGFWLAVSCYRLQVPVAPPKEPAPPFWDLLRIPEFLLVLAGGALAVFAGASFVTWGTTFGTRYQDLSVVQASISLGSLVLVGSLGGVLLGGYVADILEEHWSWGRAATVGATLFMGTPFLYLAISTESRAAFFACVFFATFFLTCYHGPTTAVIHDLTPVKAHALAFAIYLFFIHLFGDTIAPALVGLISDRRDLRAGLLLAVAANALAGICFLTVAYLIRRRSVRAGVH
ncbi:MAG TPA: MFS transporter [Terriglobia bacterium]|jgi:MFS family permease|nr:MFS transporter [Terriglobia bacterium]